MLLQIRSNSVISGASEIIQGSHNMLYPITDFDRLGELQSVEVVASLGRIYWVPCTCNKSSTSLHRLVMCPNCCAYSAAGKGDVAAASGIRATCCVNLDSGAKEDVVANVDSVAICIIVGPRRTYIYQIDRALN